MQEIALLLNDHASAALLGVSRATFWRRVRDGTLPGPIRLGGVTRWRRCELEQAVVSAAATRDRKAI